MNALAQAESLKQEAVRHKRAASYHRKQARARMEEFARFCEAHHIKLIDLAQGEEETHGQHQQPAVT